MYQFKATRWRYKTWTYPIPASTQCRATIGLPAKCQMPFKCFRCCIAKKEETKVGEGGGGEGGGGWRPIWEPRWNPFNFFGVFFFACVVVFYGLWRGEGKLLKLFVSLNRILKGGATGGCFSGLGELHVSMDFIRVFQWTEWSECFPGLDGLGVQYQLPREFGSLNELAALCIPVDCVRLGVLWRFSRLVVMGVSIVWMAYMYIFLDQKFTYHVHVAS